jgi:hypothetical protein
MRVCKIVSKDPAYGGAVYHLECGKSIYYSNSDLTEYFPVVLCTGRDEECPRRTTPQGGLPGASEPS